MHGVWVLHLHLPAHYQSHYDGTRFAGVRSLQAHRCQKSTAFQKRSLHSGTTCSLRAAHLITAAAVETEKPSTEAVGKHDRQCCRSHLVYTTHQDLLTLLLSQLMLRSVSSLAELAALAGPSLRCWVLQVPRYMCAGCTRSNTCHLCI